MRIASLFSGCGGLDLGFTNAGFKLAYANDVDNDVFETFEKNHNHPIDGRSIIDVPSEEIPDVDGIIGGPPCQSWSLAGAMRGINDNRGQLFYEYLRVLRDKKPLFFLAENVQGIVSRTHLPEFLKILKEFEEIGYTVSYKLLNAKDFGVPQERKRIVIVGYRKDLGKSFVFPQPNTKKVSLKEAIGDLPESTPAQDKNRGNNELAIANHEHMTGGFSSIYMSRNRKKEWCDPSFTIQAGGRHAPLHPDSSKMRKVGTDKWEIENENTPVRRLSIRECARIQTFPDNFVFFYDTVRKGYKMVGNAVPVILAEVIAHKIMEDLTSSHKQTSL